MQNIYKQPGNTGTDTENPQYGVERPVYTEDWSGDPGVFADAATPSARMGALSAGTGSDGPGTPATPSVTTAVAGPTVYGDINTGLEFSVTYDTTVTGNADSTMIESAFANAVNYFIGHFTNKIVINLTLQLGATDLGQSTVFLTSETYDAVKTALTSQANSASGSALQKSAVATLPNNDPTVQGGPGNTYLVSTGQAKALGLTAANGSSSDGVITISDSQTYFYDQSSPVAGSYDITAVAEHEISEVMGRFALLGDNIANGPNYSVMDLYRYSGSNVREFTGGAAAYFSIDSGQTDLKDWNTIANADYGDWASGTADSFNAFADPGAVEPVTAVDLQNMQVLGYTAACFLRGTSVLTTIGEVPIENLRINDLVVTSSGEARAIRWIGQWAYAARFVGRNLGLLPICVVADALMQGVPTRDLWVSPEHSLYIDGVLVPAKHLVNGMTVVQAAEAEELEYFHIELGSHDIIYAHGTPTETYADCGNRMMFSNAAEYERLYPNDTSPQWRFCAARVECDAPEVIAIRQRMAQRAADLGYSINAALNLCPGLADGPLAHVDRGPSGGFVPSAA